MCRILALRLDNDGAETATLLLEAFRRVAHRDPLSDNGRHCHGFGYALVYEIDGNWRVEHYRHDSSSPEPEASCRENLESLNEAIERLSGMLRRAKRALLLLHARRVLDGSPRGAQHAHPYHVNGLAKGEAFEVYLAHNGGLDKSSLSKLLGLSGEPRSIVDSQLLAMLVARGLSKWEGIDQVMKRVEGIVETALNTAILSLWSSGYIELVFYYYVVPGLTDDKKRYYEYRVFRSRGVEAILPTSLLSYFPLEGARTVKPGLNLLASLTLPSPEQA